MTSKLSRSSRESLTSIDPVIASQIIGVRSAAQSSHLRTESTPVKLPTAPIVPYAKGHGRTYSAPSKNYKRSNSLRRAKNSTEMLRQRSTRKEQRLPENATNDSKRGRNFTVTNVGTGGTLYLRPSTHQRPMSPVLSPAPLTPWTAPATTLVMPQDSEAMLLATEHTPLGRGPTTRTRSVSPKRLMERLNKTKDVQAPAPVPAVGAIRPGHVRSQSFSTLGESRKSLSVSLPKTLKIIINRTDHPRPASTKPEKPTLEIPIPHYRLGNPRFSSNGTPVLRSSTFTQVSSTPSSRSTSTIKPEVSLAGPPQSSVKAFAKLQSFGTTVDGQHAVEPVPTSAPVQAESKPKVPVRASGVSTIGAAPSIYDELSEVYNDPSVVRFAHDIREITAATPARIIAQISSESFMDYELVSDFFLTFRSYMSTLDVLDLLMARLKWAIGRLTDDGRIIRIRTFAALRHWILNYFMDDFVPDRLIRERFCEEVNDMYDDVKSHHMGVQSDLKILQDLKKCWNGRCSLYWDGREFSMDGNPDGEIFPGGVLGSRNPDYVTTDEVRHAPGQEKLHLHAVSTYTGIKPVSSPLVPSAQTQTQRSIFRPSGVAGSVISSSSIQPNSCSLPLSSSRATNENQRYRAPVPISVLARRQNAPTELTVTTNLSVSQRAQHRRGGNSIDSTRDRASVEIPKSALILPEPHEGSVIRGFVYAPVEPFVRLPANMPQSPFGPFDHAMASPPATKVQHEQSFSPGSPMVKNMFGSIRRALIGKSDSGEISLLTVSAQSSPQLQGGKKSPMPLNMSKSQDELRKKTSPIRANVRIDFLCAAAMESYQTTRAALSQASEAESKPSITDSDTLFPPPPSFGRAGAENDHQIRPSSRASGESGSILIVNDIDTETPAMSGAIQPKVTATSQGSRSSADHYLPHHDHTSFETQIAFQDDSHLEPQLPPHPTFEPTLDDYEDRRPSTPEPVRVLSSTASTNTMRHAHSLSSSEAHNHNPASPGLTVSVATPPQDYLEEFGMSSPKGAGHTLRRRPGGDLRKNQTVHELEPANTNHESVASLAGTFSTVADSAAIVEIASVAHHYAVQEAKKISMINTHSSQHLRPSFEAAVASFTSIPDDVDGGLEATLMKLEGKYEKSPDLDNYSPPPTDVDDVDQYSAPTTSFQQQDIPSSSPIPAQGYIHRIAPQTVPHPSPLGMGIQQHDFLPAHLAEKHAAFGLQGEARIMSQASADSVPLLKRDIDGLQPAIDFGNRRDDIPMHHFQAGHKKSPSHDVGGYQQFHPGHDKSQSPYDANVYRGASPGSFSTTHKSNTQSGQSLPNDEDHSDLSSEISVDIINYSEAMGSTSSPLLVAPGTAVSGLEIPSHPLAHSSFVSLSLHPSLALDSKPGPGHPNTTESVLLRIANEDSAMVHGVSDANDRINMQRGSKISAGPAHLPFVLACDSQMLAQQLTLIEQSALTEIEWSDLVEMRWSNTASSVLDWAEYIGNHNVNGIDLVITRFNLMVKWALSEIVLTQDVDERARVITKFIHVAAHARRLHNYATMLQLTIALTSSDSTRMTKTWDRVPGPDKSLLKNMESLIQPVRNFHDLRLEMESADLSDGCVPFIGLYIHDLTYNAQKPVEINIGKGQPPLVNFERFRTTAILVKGLLRLIDASSRYDFEPIHGVVERCLWIAALPDERIRSLSRSLQQPLITTVNLQS